ncbi:MAG: YfhO family protein [Blastocatellia bacterium]|nr:YfhO family protein [Blastocatellia bacterium]
MDLPTVKSRFLIGLALVSLPFIYFSPAISGRTLLAYGDNLTYSLLMRIYSGVRLAHGDFPLWNPETFSGMPFFAAIQAGVLYPANWVFAFLPAWIAMNLAVISTYHVSLIGTYLYARTIQLNVVGAFAAAVVFTFGGFMICHVEQINFIAASVWLPWVLLSLEKLRRSRSWREAWKWVAGGSLVIALHVFAGLPQSTLMIVMVSAAYLLFALIVRVDPEQNNRRFVTAAMAMCICGALLSAIQMLPAYELQQQGDRAALSYEIFATASMPPRFWLTMIIPYFYGVGLPPYKVELWDYWMIKWACSYVGLLGLLLVAIAWFGRERRSFVIFWTTVAVCAMLLATGDYLPFGINHLLYRIPVYNIFRGSYRHSFEFNFALAVLAGIGVESLARFERARARRILLRASLVLGAVVAAVAVVYLFFAQRTGADGQPPAGATSAKNLEFLVPLTMFIVGIGAAWFHMKLKTAASGAVLIAVLLLDLASFGWFKQWNVANTDKVLQELADAPAVQAIKEREKNPGSFRVISNACHPFQPYNYNYGPLNIGNLSLARGLQSANGYDPMLLKRTSALAGGMNLFGEIGDLKAFGSSDQGLNLLNVKYLIQEQPGKIGEHGEAVTVHEGVPFLAETRELQIGSGQSLQFSAGRRTATELALVTTMVNSLDIPDDAPVLRVRMYATDGSVIEKKLLAGRDTSEWAYDHGDVSSKIRHRRARIAETWKSGQWDNHRYLASMQFDRKEIERIELEYLQEIGGLVFVRGSLVDEATGSAWPVESVALPRERWRRLESFGETELYENLKVMPRAWFVRRIVALPSDEMLKVIKEGKFPDGSSFDPAEAALLEQGNFGGEFKLPAADSDSGSEVKVIDYQPQRIELRTRNSQQGFLVLSEIYYRGWEAKIDGVRVPVQRADYNLRGIPVAAGEHRVEFFFRSPSFRTGAVYSSLGAILLIAGSLAARKSQLMEHR